jgi:flagellar basal body-associated protein FliL
MVVLDFLVVRQMMEDSNMTLSFGIMIALVLCVGLEGGPTLLGSGIMMHKDKYAPKKGNGKTVSTILLLLGAIAAATAFIAYFYLRIQLILTNGGFNGTDPTTGIVQHYEGYAGDIIALISPFFTSVVAFAASIVIFTSGMDNHKKLVAQQKSKWDKAVDERARYETLLHEMVDTEWNHRFPEEKMPDMTEARRKINASIGAELGPILDAQLSLMLTPSTVLEPFVSAIKSTFRGYMGENEDLLDAIDIFNYSDETIQENLRRLLLEIKKKPSEIMGIMGSYVGEENSEETFAEEASKL